MYRFTIALTFFGLLMACESIQIKQTHSENPVALTENKVPSRVYITWEQNHPERASWSEQLMEFANGNENLFFMASDIKDFCPAYNVITRTQRDRAIAELVIAISRYESNWNPKETFAEPRTQFPTLDPITHKPVVSEGLLQLSYQDSRSYKDCTADFRSNALQVPAVNLKCGLGIMGSLLARDKRISGQYKVDGVTKYQGLARYWSVIREQKHKQDIINYVRKAVKECR